MLQAMDAARDAIPIGRLEDAMALGLGGFGLVEPALGALAEALLGEPDGLRFAEAATTLPAVIGGTIADGAAAVPVCVEAKPLLYTVDPTVAKKDADKFKASIDGLPQSFVDRTGRPWIRLRSTPIPSNPNAAAVMRRAENEIEIRTGMKRRATDQLLRHELSHAFDNVNRVSGRQEFLSAYRADMKAFGSRPGDVYLSHYAVSEREAFAQAGAHLLGKIADRAEFVKAFPKSIRAARDIFTRAGVVLP